MYEIYTKISQINNKKSTKNTIKNLHQTIKYSQTHFIDKKVKKILKIQINSVIMAKIIIIKSNKTVGNNLKYLKEITGFRIIGQILLSQRFILAIADMHIEISFKTQDSFHHHTGFVHIVFNSINKNPKIK